MPVGERVPVEERVPVGECAASERHAVHRGGVAWHTDNPPVPCAARLVRCGGDCVCDGVGGYLEVSEWRDLEGIWRRILVEDLEE